eukprot:2971622-Pleurochrysis_carterae.AAC.1
MPSATRGASSLGSCASPRRQQVPHRRAELFDVRLGADLHLLAGRLARHSGSASGDKGVVDELNLVDNPRPEPLALS